MSDFEIKPSNYLGHEYNRYITLLQETALAKPNSYFEMRRKAIISIKEQVSKFLFKTIYNILKTAQISDLTGTARDYIYKDIINIVPLKFYQNYPSQKINEIGLSAAKTIDEVLNDVIEILLPPEITKVVGEKLERQGNKSLM